QDGLSSLRQDGTERLPEGAPTGRPLCGPYHPDLNTPMNKLPVFFRVAPLWRLLGLGAAVGLGCFSAVAAPTNVIIRTTEGVACPAELPALLAKWRQSGQVANVLLLTDGRPEKPG